VAFAIYSASIEERASMDYFQLCYERMQDESIWNISLEGEQCVFGFAA